MTRSQKPKDNLKKSRFGRAVTDEHHTPGKAIINMAFAAYGRKSEERTNMVFDLYFPRGTKDRVSCVFVLEVHQVDAESGEIQTSLLRCNGSGIREFAAALAFLDILSGCYYPETPRKVLERWFYSGEARSTRPFSLRGQIHRETEPITFDGFKKSADRLLDEFIRGIPDIDS